MFLDGVDGRVLRYGEVGQRSGKVLSVLQRHGVTQGEGMTSVASYRLAVHLGLAFVILGLIAWYVMALAREERELMQARRGKEAKLYGLATGWLHFAFLQILIGALVAGIDAGRTYTDWPLMAGGFTPPAMWALDPGWRNLFENDGTVQFIHRMAGYLLLAFGIVVWLLWQGGVFG